MRATNPAALLRKSEMCWECAEQYRAGGRCEIRFVLGNVHSDHIGCSKQPWHLRYSPGDDPDSWYATCRMVFRIQPHRCDVALKNLSQRVGFIENPVSPESSLDVRGTAFSNGWGSPERNSRGQTASYPISPSDRRAEIGASRRAGMRNKQTAVAIPCHRVVRNDGALAGYRWGVSASKPSRERGGGEASGKYSHNTSASHVQYCSCARYSTQGGCVDWLRISNDLDAQGSTVIERFVSPEECGLLPIIVRMTFSEAGS